MEPHIRRLLERYELNVLDVFQGPEHLREVLAASALPPELQQNFDRTASGLEASLRELAESLGRLDHTLVDAAHHAGAKMHYQLEQLRKRAAQAEIRRSEILNRHAAQLSSCLFPERNLQERVLGGICFLARDPDLLSKLYDAAFLTCSDHQLVYL